MTLRIIIMQLALLLFVSAAPVVAQDTPGNSTENTVDVPVIPADYKEEGVASWYGEKFHGKLTASGDPYDMDKMTAAHNYLPLGVKVTVTNLSNNKRVDVVINDRGPFVPDRIIDLSCAAAAQLDFIDTGKAKVRIEAFREKPEVVSAPASVSAPKKVAATRNLYGAFYIQVGAYKVKANADRLVERLHKAGFNNTRMVRVVTDSAQIFKVQIGMYKTLAKARSAHLKLVPGFSGTFVLADVIQDQ